MKLKRLTIVFQDPLDKHLTYQGQDCTQEEILFADVEGIRVKVKRELDRVLRSINMVRIMNPAMFDVLKFHVQGLERKLVWMIEFKKITPTKYEFIFPTDANALLTIKDISSKLGPLKKFALGKLENKDLQLVKLLREAELIQAFEKFSFKEMKLEPGTWCISTDEFENDPEAPPAQVQGQGTDPITGEVTPKQEESTDKEVAATTNEASAPDKKEVPPTIEPTASPTSPSAEKENSPGS